MKYDEKRAFMRIDLNSEMQYRLVDASEFKAARCTSLSGSGVSFVATQTVDEGKAIEINITPQNSITPALTAFVEVVRVESLTDGEYEIAATIKTIKG
jgi:hypothetical protein